MTLRFIDGFDHYATAHIDRKWTSSSNAAISALAARHGSSGLRLSSAAFAAYVLKTLTAKATWVVGCAFRPANLSQEAVVLALVDSGSVQVEVRILTSGLLRVVRGDNAATLATGSTALSANVWHFIEFKATIHGSSGSYELRIDGATEVSGSGANTQATGTATANQVALGDPSGGVFDAMSQDHDDFYVLDSDGSANNDFLGDCRVETLLPSGAGTNTAWTPSSGDNYAAVDDATPDDDTTYVASSTADQKDTYAMANLGTSPSEIFGVQTCLTARKDDADARSVAALVRASGTDYAGSTVALSTDYACLLEVRETDPSTTVPWTESGINNIECGVKMVA